GGVTSWAAQRARADASATDRRPARWAIRASIWIPSTRRGRPSTAIVTAASRTSARPTSIAHGEAAAGVSDGGGRIAARRATSAGIPSTAPPLTSNPADRRPRPEQGMGGLEPVPPQGLPPRRVAHHHVARHRVGEQAALQAPDVDPPAQEAVQRRGHAVLDDAAPPLRLQRDDERQRGDERERDDAADDAHRDAPDPAHQNACPRLRGKATRPPASGSPGPYRFSR